MTTIQVPSYYVTLPLGLTSVEEGYAVGLYIQPNCPTCQWSWSDGTTISSYTNWMTDSPDEWSFCGAIYGGMGWWYNNQCEFYTPFICQIPTHVGVCQTCQN